jgi:glycosyltransferase involved in cell wall biosynthesis
MTQNSSLIDLDNELHEQFKLAIDWHTSGKLALAIAEYQKILLRHPNYILAYLNLGQILLEQRRFREAVNLYIQAIEFNPNQPEFHKNFISTMAAKMEFEEAFKYYELTRIDTKEIEILQSDILCCVVVRNELLRLPYFLDFYRQKGITKFLIVDNNSSDGSLAYLQSQPDVYIWHSPLSKNKANLGSAWLELLLSKYGEGNWCLIVDADEIFYYPYCEKKNIVQLCQELDINQKIAYSAVVLDMYSDKAIKDTHYLSGTNFLESCPYFDQKFYHNKVEKGGLYNNQTCYFGGVRRRVFGGNELDYCLNKVPLLKYNRNVLLSGGQHWTNIAEQKIAEGSGCLLHFKYFSTEHQGNAIENVQDATSIVLEQNRTFYNQEHSVKLQDSQQLVELGIMQIGESEPAAIVVEFPKIYSVPVNVSRPFWSVIIPTYKRVNYVEQVLRSVLEQAPSKSEMQIEVVNGAGASESIQAEIAEVVKAVGGERADFYGHSEHVDQVQMFNICIQRATGHWVHILHDDDFVKPGFYHHLRAGIEQDKSVGAAFCRSMLMNSAGQETAVHFLERETPGVIEDWLERIAMECRVPFPSIVVKRDVYEKLGGFCPQANSAADWEMWKRIAVYYPIWYEPQALANNRLHSRSETNRLNKIGQVAADGLKAIEISHLYFPTAVRDRLTNKARKHYASYALAVAKQQLEEGNVQAAIANLQEGFKLSQSAQIKQLLIFLLQHTKSSQ